jgi:hypothetical protein
VFLLLYPTDWNSSFVKRKKRIVFFPLPEDIDEPTLIYVKMEIFQKCLKLGAIGKIIVS